MEIQKNQKKVAVFRRKKLQPFFEKTNSANKKNAKPCTLRGGLHSFFFISLDKLQNFRNEKPMKREK